MAASGLLPSFLAAIQASISVLLVIFYGGIAAHFSLLDSKTGSKISKMCVKMFLPALLFVKIGSQLHLESAHRYLIILLWAFACHILSFFIGVGAHYGLRLPDWVTAAIMFNNTTSYPLLLIQSLDETGILSSLITSENETSSEAIERAKSYFLVFATISSCLTFSIGPRLIDSEHAPDPPNKEEIDDADDEAEHDENTGLLSAIQDPIETWHRASVTFFPSSMPKPREQSRAVIYDRRPSVIPKARWLDLHPRSKWWLLFIWDFFNAPLLSAIVGAIVGLVPPLHRAFFNDTSSGGIFTAWLTASLKTIGQLFVPLPVVIAGVSLYTSIKATKHSHNTEPATPWLPTTFILIIRFIVWPAVSISLIYGLASRTNWLGDDPMLYFTLMLMPTGPSAMKLITMIQVSGADEKEEHKIAKLLTISYAISPILAFTVVGALKASQAAVSS